MSLYCITCTCYILQNSCVFDESCVSRSSIVQYCPVLSSIVQYCPVLSSIVQYCHLLVTENPCIDTPTQQNGHTTVCGTSPFPFGSTCEFECDAGFTMAPGGKTKATCVISLPDMPEPGWDGPLMDCTSEPHTAPALRSIHT